MKTSWDATLPPGILIKQINHAAELSRYVNPQNLVTRREMINSGGVTILSTGLFPHEYKDWKNIPDHERTWEKFQEFWCQAWDNKNMHDVTAAQVRYRNHISIDPSQEEDATVY